MARKRDSEKTRQLILDVSKNLFLEQGYEETSVQDIIDGLGGLTKGVIYHYFDSKYDILKTILRLSVSSDFLDEQWRGETGLEKLQNFLIDSFSDHHHVDCSDEALLALRTSKVLGDYYTQQFKEFAPEVSVIIQEGIVDGSIQTDYPEELAELFVLTINLWLRLQIGASTQDEISNRTLFLKQMFELLNVQIITDDVLKQMFLYFETHSKK